MTAAQWGVIGVIGTLILGAITLYYLAKSSAREQARQQREAVDSAVVAATQPLNAEITRLREDGDQLREDKRELRRRIDQLEDQLRLGGSR